MMRILLDKHHAAHKIVVWPCLSHDTVPKTINGGTRALPRNTAVIPVAFLPLDERKLIERYLSSYPGQTGVWADEWAETRLEPVI